jgi:hypothetical protein
MKQIFIFVLILLISCNPKTSIKQRSGIKDNLTGKIWKWSDLKKIFRIKMLIKTFNIIYSLTI